MHRPVAAVVVKVIKEAGFILAKSLGSARLER